MLCPCTRQSLVWPECNIKIETKQIQNASNPQSVPAHSSPKPEIRLTDGNWTQEHTHRKFMVKTATRTIVKKCKHICNFTKSGYIRYFLGMYFFELVYIFLKGMYFGIAMILKHPFYLQNMQFPNFVHKQNCKKK